MKDICYQMNRKALIVMLFALCLAFPALAQKLTVQGTVVDPTGEPLIGASVMVKGTSSGTATDFDGHFRIEATPNSTLVVSYVGYESQNVPVNGRSTIKVTLKENSKVLDEVVAIGYGTVKKEDATGAVATIKPSEIKAGISTSVQDLLVGQTPGVVVTTSAGPEGGGTIRVRGGSSLNASNDPLIVVDGVPLDNKGVLGMTNDLAMIAPDNIESMTVLKDASATAIYGSRASNGVIIITTKKGKSGKPQVNFSANMYVNTARKTWDVLDANTYAEKIINFFGADSDAAKALTSYKDANGNVYYKNTKWQDEVLRTTVSSDYNLSVGGAVGFLPYRVAATYSNNNGILKTTKMDRFTFGFNLTPKFLDNHLAINANAKGYYMKNQQADGGAIGAALAQDPTMPVHTDYPMAEGSVGSIFNGYTVWRSQAVFNANSTQNPLAMVDCRSDKTDILRSNGNLQFDYSLHFLPELHLNLNLGYDVSRSKRHILTDENSPLAWHNTANDGAATDNYEYQFKSNTLLDFYASYKKEFEAIYSNLDVTAGYSWQRFHMDGWRNGTEFTSLGYNIPTLNANGETILTYNDATQNRIGTSYNDRYDYANHLQLLSFFGRLNYTFMNRYLFTFTMRGDASSRFAKGNRWGKFPSVALGWRVSDEAWMAGTKDVMNELKLRLGWGITGQQGLEDAYFPYLATYQQAVEGSYYPSLTGEGGYGTTLYPTGANPKVKWEETTTWNAGLDFGFLNNRITAAFDIYYRKTKDLLSFVPVPAGSSTTDYLYQNIGTLDNKGVEFSIVARPVVTKDFTWTVNYNVAYNKNKIVKLNNDGTFVPVGYISGATGNTCQVHKEGSPAFSYYLYEQVYGKDGLPIEGQFVDQNGDGQITDADKIVRHSRDPKVTMTFSSQFNYKNWDLGFSLRASIGNYVYANVLAQRTNINKCYDNYNLNNLLVSDFYFEGKTTTNTYMSDYWLRNASYLRCDNITLGYSFPEFKNIMKLRLYGAVQNPFVITKYKGLDPEVFDGIDNNIYPRPVTFTLGLVATF